MRKIKKHFLNLFILIFIFTIVMPFSHTSVKAQESKIINLDIQPMHSIIDPNRPIIYIIAYGSNKVYAVNYENGEIKSVEFDEYPTGIAFSNNEIYVALSKIEEQSEDLRLFKGIIGIINADSFSIIEQFDIDIYPFDIEVDDKQNIYVSPNSIGKENIQVYSRMSKHKIADVNDSHSGYFLHYNSHNSTLYYMDSVGPYGNMGVYGYSQGEFQKLYDSSYQKKYSLSSKMQISPDGKFIFNGSGNIFSDSNLQDSYIPYVGRLAYGFTDVAFSDNKIYAGMSKNNIIIYNYSDFSYIGSMPTKVIVSNLYYRNNILISLGKMKNNSYAIELIDLKDGTDTLSKLEIVNQYPENNAKGATVDGYVTFEFNDDIYIDLNKQFMEGSLVDYIYDKRLINNKLILYYRFLNYDNKYSLKLKSNSIFGENGKLFLKDYALTLNTGKEYDRFAGLDRYETSTKISQSSWTQSDYIVLATGEDYPDALCAAPLATKYLAPILLTNKNSLPPIVESEINRLNPKQIFIVGGSGAVSDNIKNKLQNKGIKVIRLSGIDRYETSLAIAKYLNSQSNKAFLVTGENYPDALSIASYAANKEIPILLTERDKVPTSIKTYINNAQINTSYIIGGTGVISDKVLYSLPNSVRIAGSDRYETNLEVLSSFDYDFTEVYVATGEQFADALSGAALAGVFNSPLILAHSSMPSSIVEVINYNKDIMRMKKILGGTGAISDSIINKLFK